MFSIFSLLSGHFFYKNIGTPCWPRSRLKIAFHSFNAINNRCYTLSGNNNHNQVSLLFSMAFKWLFIYVIVSFLWPLNLDLSEIAKRTNVKKWRRGIYQYLTLILKSVFQERGQRAFCEQKKAQPKE